ncbi:uncharacterized protein LOC134672182 [Cydia fagiglandana]|uniref:uncharacterized protein LOC134672182 n=1 Tax=Cydia fagiglandana TaxID=1458189 RepID=UPI002FEE2B82
MAQWEGFSVSVRCGSPLGCYQGTILAADGASITLTKPFRNGFPYPKAQVTLKASDIKSLEIISGKTSGGTAHSTVPVVGKKRVPRATVGESLQEQAPAPPPPVVNKSKPARSKPIDIQAKNRNNTHAGSYGATGSTPKTRMAGGDKARRKNEACFGSAALEAVDNDFDFEGNLALFDKEALWQQMRPDVVRVAAARDEMAAGGKLRHDQNVLRTTAPDTAPVTVPPALRGARDYVTDSGTRLPSVSAALRGRLWAGLRRTDDETQHTARALFARATADVALKLVGGTRRLDPRNAHQRPRAGVVAGRGAGAAAAVSTARLLRAHGVDTYVVPLDAAAAAAVSTARLLRAHGVDTYVVPLDAASAAAVSTARLLRAHGVDTYVVPLDAAAAAAVSTARLLRAHGVDTYVVPLDAASAAAVSTARLLRAHGVDTYVVPLDAAAAAAVSTARLLRAHGVDTYVVPLDAAAAAAVSTARLLRAHGVDTYVVPLDAAAAAAVSTARLLRAHGVDTYVVPLDDTCPLVTSALSAYRLCGGRVLGPTDPRPAGDLLLLALHDPETSIQHPSTPQALEWASTSRGALVILEPGGDDSGLWDSVLLSARAVLVALLPPSLSAVAPRLLLANVAPPAQLFGAVGVAYRSPFGAASVLALHLADDDD